VGVVSALQAGHRRRLADRILTRDSTAMSTALISIHADSCDYINDMATGFKIAGSAYTDSFVVHLRMLYRRSTEMSYHAIPSRPIWLIIRHFVASRPVCRPSSSRCRLHEPGFADAYAATSIGCWGITDGIWCFLDQIRAASPTRAAVRHSSDGG
jgi:hypothetical protein